VKKLVVVLVVILVVGFVAMMIANWDASCAGFSWSPSC